MFRPTSREPNFENFIKMLSKQPSRPVLFEFIISSDKERFLTGSMYNDSTEWDRVLTTIRAFDSAGYDHAPIIIRGMEFPRHEEVHENVRTKSLNEGTMITDWKTFKEYPWQDVNNCDFDLIKRAGKFLHPKVKFTPFSHDGILENTIGIVGYENLCLMLYDDPKLVEAIFYEVGKRIAEYFERCLEYDKVGAIICNDDWGFNTQTMLPPDVLRKYVFPWYKKIVGMAHQKNKFALLHSCGYYHDIINDIIYDMKFDGKHSFEDKIVPVEKAYLDLKGKIAVVGGIDVNFLTRASKEEVYDRAIKLLRLTKEEGGFALGSGNSIPDFIPLDNYLAMLQAAFDEDKL